MEEKAKAQRYCCPVGFVLKGQGLPRWNRGRQLPRTKRPSAVDMAIKRWEALIAREPHMRALRDELIDRLNGLSGKEWKMEG
jgi:hypothetical protein